MKEIRRILFIRTDRMGDALMNLPALRLLRQTYPKAWIALLAEKAVADLFTNHPDLDEVMRVDVSGLKVHLGDCWNLFRRIREAKFDLAVISNPGKFFHALVFLCGIPRRVGYARKWGFLLNQTIHGGPERLNRHEIENNLELVRLISDKTWDGGISIPIDKQASHEIRGLLMQAFPGNLPIIVFHAGTSNPEKRWPVENFAELMHRIISEKGLQVLLIGGPEEAFRSEKLRETVGSSVVNWTGVLNLRQLAALIGNERVKALVSSDSGPMHIAWILGKPVVALFAKNSTGSNPERWGPRNGKSQVIYKSMNEITPGEVFACLEKTLAT